MSPRRNRPRPDEPPERPEGGRGAERIEDGWVVRSVTGESAKTYRCPGCDQEIRPGVPHVVAWRQADAEDRRHWHTPCWQARGRRGPWR